MKREVWIAQEAMISIWEEDGSGGYDDASGAVFEDKFVQDVSCREVLDVQSDGQPGAAVKDIDTFPGGYELRIGEFYFKKGTQINPFTDRTKRFRIVVSFVNPQYSGIEPEENDPHILRDAAKTEWEISWQDNQVVSYRASFKAERME